PCTRTCCATPLPAMCCSPARICAPCRSCWAMPASPPPRSIPGWIFSTWPRSTTRPIRARAKRTESAAFNKTKRPPIYIGGRFIHYQSVKSADKPDSVHLGCPRRDRHYSGPGVATTARRYLPANSAEPHQRWPTWYCCAQRLPVSPRSLRDLGGYRVSGLRLNVWLAPAGTRLRGLPDRTPLVAEDDLTRLCCSNPHLTVGSR